MLWKGIPASPSHIRPWWGGPKGDPAAAAAPGSFKSHHCMFPTPCAHRLLQWGASLLPWDPCRATGTVQIPKHSHVLCT